MNELIGNKESPKKVNGYLIYSSTFNFSQHSDISLAIREQDNQPYLCKSYNKNLAQTLSQWIYKEIETKTKEILKDEVSLCKYYFSNEHNSYLLYDYFPSNNLYEILSPQSIALSLPEKIEISKKLANIIHSIHSKGFIHRNINPRHILISKENGRIILSGSKYLTNFKIEGYPWEAIGAEIYKAPEMDISEISKKPYNEKVDIYSFGITLLFMFSNTIINENVAISNIMENDKSFISSPQEIQNLIYGCLNENIEERLDSYQICEEKYYPLNSNILNNNSQSNTSILNPKLNNLEVTIPNFENFSPEETKKLKSKYVNTSGISQKDSGNSKTVCFVDPFDINTVKLNNQYSQSANFSKTINLWCNHENKYKPNIEKLKNLTDEKINENKIQIRVSLDPYEKLEYLAEGSYGRVFKAEDKKTKKEFALKIIKKNSYCNEKNINLIFDEIKHLKELKDSSLIPTLHDVFIFKGEMYLVLEYCNGRTLNYYVKKLYDDHQNFLDIDQIKLILCNIAEGMWLLHKRNIVHRDLKPDNILLNWKNEVTKEYLSESKITDLGLSRKLDINNPEFKTKVGTEYYLAPELRKGNSMFFPNSFNKTVDVFSFGLIIYFMIYGNHAGRIQANYKNFRMGKIDLPKNKARNLPDSLYNLMEKCLKVNPSERISFQDITQHPFLQEVVPKNLNLNKNKSELNEIMNTSNSICYIYTENTKQFWLKIYNQSFYESNKKYINGEINFYLISKPIPHVVNLINYGFLESAAHNKSYPIGFLFDYFENGSLLDLYTKRKKIMKPNEKIFKLNEIQKVAKFLIIFIEHLHSKNQYHRNISPKHILVILDHDGIITDIKVCGFWKSKTYSNPTNTLYLNNESTIYTDPDIISGKNNFTNSSDLWSIGILISFMIFEMTPKKNVMMNSNQ